MTTGMTVAILVVALLVLGGLVLLFAADRSRAEREATGGGGAREVPAPSLLQPSGSAMPELRQVDPFEEELRRLTRGGQKIEAIRRLREAVRCGLKEAKDAVEAIERGEPSPIALRPTAAAPAAAPAPLADPRVEEVAAIVRAGRLIEAIKRCRELTGADLRSAKEAVDALARGEPLATLPGPSAAQAAAPPSSPAGAALDEAEITALARGGRLIEAIKRYREATGLGLAEAKAAVERLRDRA